MMSTETLTTKEETQLYKKKLGANIQAVRNERGLTQQQLAEKIGIAVPTLGCIEIGKSQPQMRTLISLSKALGVDIYRFFVFSNSTGVDLGEKLGEINQKINSFKDNERAILALSYFLENFK